jgi:hypothetical protein
MGVPEREQGGHNDDPGHLRGPAERRGLPEPNKAGEQPWRPVLPKDREKIEAFVNDLTQNKEELLSQLQTYLHKPDKNRDELALAIYLDAVVKRDVLGIDPFASKHPGDEAHQETREYIAFLAAEHVGQRWLDEHPDSELAELVADFSIYAPDFMHRAFLYEIWPSVRSKFATED